MKKHPVLSYVALTYFMTWVIAVPLAATTHKIFNIAVSYKLHYLTAYGPMLSALIMTAIISGRKGLKHLFAKTMLWKVKAVWYAIAFSPLIIYLAITGAMQFWGKSTDFSLLGQIHFLPNLGWKTLLLWIFNSGLGEEIGWRGFALPHLQKKFSPVKSSLILSLFWIGWHIPAFFYLPTYIKLGLSIFPFFALGIASGAIVYTWIYNNTKGSLLIVMLFHGTFNFITASKAGEGLPSALISSLIIMLALILIILKPKGIAASPSSRSSFRIF